jgi:replicative DNA helicase
VLQVDVHHLARYGAADREVVVHLQQQHGIGMIVIDYLQLMTGSARAESRQQEISMISRSLKGMAKDLDVPVLALSQLSRAVESRSDHKPMLSDLAPVAQEAPPAGL